MPADAVVAGNPLTGASLSYAFAGRETLLPHGTTAATEEGQLIFDELDTMLQNPRVCDAVRSTNLGFVLDFGNASVHGGNAPVMPGLSNLSPESGFELLDREGEASLYRVTGCG